MELILKQNPKLANRAIGGLNLWFSDVGICWRLKLSNNDTKREGIAISKHRNHDTSNKPRIGYHSSVVSRYPPAKKHPKFKIFRGIVVSSSLISRYQYREGTKMDKKGSLCPPEALIIKGSFKGFFGLGQNSCYIS
ncbi:hypothetical protein J1N35_034188 [Gossypium stocksii]|uniref:Uncharacterized protein n=1 Tax=Gossypium stocksii TaxID=47602 RepID=A0A9D3ZPZ6_9ROSI|nr:hypothetical protein J1N35_034188 [Gossypium stocksii]